jgi:hypothetical protein
MAELAVIVPTRGRPHTVAELAEAFRTTCSEPTRLMLAIEHDDPAADAYMDAAVAQAKFGPVEVFTATGGTMVSALNTAAAELLRRGGRAAIGFMGDDHRPRTMGWDAAYLEALRLTPGLVYGDDRIQGARLPTQVAISAQVVQALGHMAPPTLQHMYVDNYWLSLGRAAGRITYLPGVVVEHLHPAAGTAQIDEGYLRVNSREVFERDEAALAAYWAEHGGRDIAAVRSVVAASCD